MANRKTLIRIKAVPKKPVRKEQVPCEVPIYNGTTLRETMDELVRVGGNPFTAKFILGGGFYGDDYVLKFNLEESVADFKIRTEAYRKRLLLYETWYKEIGRAHV